MIKHGSLSGPRLPISMLRNGLLMSVPLNSYSLKTNFGSAHELPSQASQNPHRPWWGWWGWETQFPHKPDPKAHSPFHGPRGHSSRGHRRLGLQNWSGAFWDGQERAPGGSLLSFLLHRLSRKCCRLQDPAQHSRATDR